MKLEKNFIRKQTAFIIDVESWARKKEKKENLTMDYICDIFFGIKCYIEYLEDRNVNKKIVDELKLYNHRVLIRHLKKGGYIND